MIPVPEKISHQEKDCWRYGGGDFQEDKWIRDMKERNLNIVLRRYDQLKEARTKGTARREAKGDGSGKLQWKKVPPGANARPPANARPSSGIEEIDVKKVKAEQNRIILRAEDELELRNLMKKEIEDYFVESLELLSVSLQTALPLLDSGAMTHADAPRQAEIDRPYGIESTTSCAFGTKKTYDTTPTDVVLIPGLPKPILGEVQVSRSSKSRKRRPLRVFIEHSPATPTEVSLQCCNVGDALPSKSGASRPTARAAFVICVTSFAVQCQEFTRPS